MKVGITGSTGYHPDDEVSAAVLRLVARHAELTILTRSEEDGVDKVAADYARVYGVEWQAVGPARLVNESDMLLAFYLPKTAAELRWKSRGTTAVVLAALHRGIPVHVHHQGRYLKVEELGALGHPHPLEKP